MNDVAKVAQYDFGTDSWTTHDWSSDCSGCTGFGIDVSSSRYFATMDGTNDHKLVVGDY